MSTPLQSTTSPSFAHWLSGPRARGLSIALIAVGFLVIAIQLAGTVTTKDYDFSAFRAASLALLAGENPYASTSHILFIYPLFFALVMIPVSILPGYLPDLIWFLFNVAVLVALFLIVMRRCHRLFGTPWGNVLWGFGAFMMILNFGVLQGNFGNGQANFLVALLCVLFMECLLEQRKGWAAAFLAAGIAIKLVPLLFFAYLLFHRDFKTMALTIFFTLIFIFAPVLFLGMDLFPIYKTYVERFVIGGLTGSVHAPFKDAIISSHGIFSSGQDGVIYYSLSSTLVHFVPAARNIPALGIIAGLAVASGLFFLSWQTHRATAAASAFWELQLYPIAILLLDPMCQRPHMGLALPACIALTACLLYAPPFTRAKNRVALAGFLLLQALAMLAPYGPYKFALLVVMALFLGFLSVGFAKGARTGTTFAPRD